MSGKLLVTGASGFVGRHVREACAIGGSLQGMQLHTAPASWDIREPGQVAEWVGSVMPDVVLHLAAQSFVPRSFENPRETFDVNLIGTLNLLQALTATGFRGRMVYVSSGDVYGRVPEQALPVTERRTPEPRSPYAVSKLAAESLCLQWHRTEGLDVMIARPFNHVGPGQDARFVLPALARQVVAIADGRQEAVIDAGDIDTTRDFTDVRDVVSAYAAMIARGRPGATYLIGSGVERRVRDLLTAMCAIEGIAPEIRQDPSRMRPAEQRRMAADASLLRAETGWEQHFSIETTLTDILKETRINA